MVHKYLTAGHGSSPSRIDVGNKSFYNYNLGHTHLWFRCKIECDCGESNHTCICWHVSCARLQARGQSLAILPKAIIVLVSSLERYSKNVFHDTRRTKSATSICLLCLLHISLHLKIMSQILYDILDSH